MSAAGAPRQVVSLSDVPRDALPEFGGKAIGLAALLHAGLPVPSGFCVSAHGFVEAIRSLGPLVGALDSLSPDALDMIRGRAAELRAAVMSLPLDSALADEIARAWRLDCDSSAVAVRSSATAEDLADASFAGQQDTFLDRRSIASVLDAVRSCWASLFTDRAVVYRLHHGISSSHASMAVVVQRMVNADAAGVVFTADPATGHRGQMVVEAVRGLGESFVSGHSNPDTYKVRRSDHATIDVKTAGAERILDDAQVERLVKLAESAEHARGAPQDIEWALASGDMFLLQARPITTLNPLPEPLRGGYRVYASFGHVQVNTSPLPPFTRSLFMCLVPIDRDEKGRSRLLVSIGARIYADVTTALSDPRVRERLLGIMRKMSPQVADRLAAVAARPELRSATLARPLLAGLARVAVPVLLRALRVVCSTQRGRRRRYEARLDAGVAAARNNMTRGGTAAEKQRRMREVIAHVFEWLMFESAAPMLVPMVASERVLSALLRKYAPGLAPDALLRGLRGNVTTEMNLELGDLADLMRTVPALERAVRSSKPVTALSALRDEPSGRAFFAGWDAFLLRYGQRTAGEIDVSLPRWRENPTPLLRSLSASLDRPRGQHRTRQREVEAESAAAVDDVVRAASGGFLGALRGRAVRSFIEHARSLHALREHHKVALTQVLDVVRMVTLDAAEQLVLLGTIDRPDDVWWLEVEEVELALEGRGLSADEVRARVAQRRQAATRYASWSVPAVLTSEGEAVQLPARAGAPAGTLVGVPVSSGVVEATVRVVLDPNRDDLRAGEILVAPFTDPGWTPLFTRAAGLIMEIGGTMTHGSVVARELGIPAVVGIERATRVLQTGQRVRLDADRGWITVLDG